MGKDLKCNHINHTRSPHNVLGELYNICTLCNHRQNCRIKGSIECALDDLNYAFELARDYEEGTKWSGNLEPDVKDTDYVCPVEKSPEDKKHVVENPPSGVGCLTITFKDGKKTLDLSQMELDTLLSLLTEHMTTPIQKPT